jgi:membrane-associated phospholipid phosphatase
MFQTEIHIALQALASKSLTWLMLQVTSSGYIQFIIAMVMAVMLGINLRKGFLLFQIIAWTVIVSEMSKQLFGLPRPFFADSRVACLEAGWDTATPFRAMGGKTFFALPQQQVIDAFRLKGISFGFPSGHASGACATWGGLAVIFRKRALCWLAPFMVLLLIFSRLYLGVHFLADVLGGILLGGLILLLAWRIIGSDESRERFFAAAGTKMIVALPGILYLLFLFILPLLLVFFQLLSVKFAGMYIGLNAAFTLALRSGLPEDKGSIPVRLARVLLGGLLFWLLSLGLRLAITLVPAVAVSAWGNFLSAALGTFLSILGGLKLFERLGLYRKETMEPAQK